MKIFKSKRSKEKNKKWKGFIKGDKIEFDSLKSFEKWIKKLKKRG